MIFTSWSGSKWATTKASQRVVTRVSSFRPRSARRCLTYLFADRFVRPMSWSNRILGQLALVTPTSGTLVHIVDVQLHCLATALRVLQHHGLITISDKAPSASNLLGRIGEHELLLERVGGGEDLVGLEGQVLSSLPAEPVVARDLLYLDAFDIVPVDALLVPVQEEAVAANVLVLPEREGRAPQSLSWSVHARYEIREMARRSLEAQFRSADEAGLLVRDQPQLFKRVLKECALPFRRIRGA